MKMLNWLKEKIIGKENNEEEEEKVEFKVRLRVGTLYFHPQFSYGTVECWQHFHKYEKRNNKLSYLCGNYNEMVDFLLTIKTYKDVLTHNEREQDKLDKYLDIIYKGRKDLPFDIVE